MLSKLNILVTNDDGYRAKGIKILTQMVRHFGSATVIAPKNPQSGMSTALSMGFKPIASKTLCETDGVKWAYVDGTPATCVKFAKDIAMADNLPNVVVSGVNHGSNAATAANYSGTMGAAEEAALNGMLGIAVSLDNKDADADFSAVEKWFPQIFQKIIASYDKAEGQFYNLNFPSLPLEKIKGIRVGHQGLGYWEKEFELWDLEKFPLPEIEEGETIYVMKGSFVDQTPLTDRIADHHILEDGFISITVSNVNNCDCAKTTRLESAGLNEDF